MATDWTALRVEYVTTSITLRELADRHAIKAAGVMRRAAKEGWEAERKQESAKVSSQAIAASTPERAEELAKFNEDDLRMARAIRDKAASMMDSDLSPNDLRALAGAVDTAQKVGRLALGASTENSSVTTKSLPAGVDEFI